MATPRTPTPVKIGWRRDGRTSTEAEADDWHLRFDLTTDSCDGAGNTGWMCVAFRQYGVYHAATPDDWKTFLAPDGISCVNELCSDGGCADSICNGALHRYRKRGSVRITVETECGDTDALLRVAVPEEAILPALRDVITYLTDNGKYYPDKWAPLATDALAGTDVDSYSSTSALSSEFE